MGFKTLLAWARDLVLCDREQLVFMPPSLNDWPPDNHVVWTILGAVEAMDLTPVEEAYGCVRRTGV